MKNINLKILKDFIKRNIYIIIIYIVILSINFICFFLYNLVFEPFIYSVILSSFILIILFVIDILKSIYNFRKRQHIINSITDRCDKFLKPGTLLEEDYQRIIVKLNDVISSLNSKYDKEQRDMLDYYTVWVHQIKTPIAVMRMILAEKDSEEYRALSSELFRIEQYVEMVLQYIRLDSDTNDFVIQEYSLDSLIRECIRKYAAQFIGRKLELIYNPTDIKIVTDKKWFTCIIEQLLSNAIKYTPSGSVTINVSDDIKICISDTGIGIAKEDLPRIFEKGYTGGNGRYDKRSSGLGLYLCKRAADKLSIRISAESELGKGSAFTLSLSNNRII